MTEFTIARRSLLGGAASLAATSGAWAAVAKPQVLIRTDHGDIVVELEAQKAPLSSANFLRYVDAKAYDGASFFRTTKTPGAPSDGTIVGRPAPAVRPFPPIAHESTAKTGLRHLDGTISLGRFAPGSATDDIFICVGPQPGYDADPSRKGDNLGFAAFGRVIDGMGVVRRIHGLNANGPSPFADQKGQWLKRPVLIRTMRRA